MDLKTAIKIYHNTAGPDYQRPSKTKSYERNSAMHLLGDDGALLAVVHADRSVVFGPALLAWSRQLQLGMPAPRR